MYVFYFVSREVCNNVRKCEDNEIHDKPHKPTNIVDIESNSKLTRTVHKEANDSDNPFTEISKVGCNEGRRPETRPVVSREYT